MDVYQDVHQEVKISRAEVNNLACLSFQLQEWRPYFQAIIVFIPPLLDITNFSEKFFVLSKNYTDEGGINSYTTVCPSVRKIIHEL